MTATGVTRVAAVDIGTNSLRLLIADVDARTGRASEIERRTEIVRLGQDVDRTKMFAPQALARTFAGLDTYGELIKASGVVRCRCVATSAVRDVGNREEFVAGVLSRLGVAPEVVSGAEEAGLCYDGAIRGLADSGVAPPVLVLDIGGGSTEVVRRPCPDGPVMAASLDIGSVRLTERYLRSDPPTPEQVRDTLNEIESALDTLDPAQLADVGTMIGVAGSVTTMAAMVLGLPRYDRRRLEGAWLATGRVVESVESIVAMSVAERAALPYMVTGRADVIAAGALILGSVLSRARLTGLRVSEHDILDGVAWSLV